MKRESEKRTVKVGNLVIDEKLTRLRPVNMVFVSRYRQAYRSGRDLGEIIVDSNLRVVSGNHRVTAMVEEYGPDHECTVTVKPFTDERAVLEEFAANNVAHGNALSGASRRAIAVELIRNGASVEEVAQVFGVSARRIEEWGGQTVFVIGGRSGKSRHPQPMPAKRGIEPGTEMDKDQYEMHWTHDRGIRAVSQAEQLERWVRNGWVKDDESVAALRRLNETLNTFLTNDEGATA